MRSPLATFLAAATACAVAAVAAGSAQAVGGIPVPSVTPLPTVTVPAPTPTVSVPVPEPTLPPVPSLPTGGVGTPSLPGPGQPSNPTGGSGPSGGGGGGSGATGSLGSGTDGLTGAARGPADLSPAQQRRQRLADRSTPMIAGTAAARDLLDDESSPALLAASQDFLAADQAIAEIARQKRLMADLKVRAFEMAYEYRAIGYDAITARAASDALHERYAEVLARWVSGAREAYATGRPGDDGSTSGVTAALARLSDGGARADMRLGALTVRREQVRTDFELVAGRYNETKRQLEDTQKRLAVLNALRTNALQAVYAAEGSDVALNRARMVESGQLGAQINEASAGLDRAGTTVRGTGTFARPVEGQITSPFGMRMHPILRYVKLHTGLDLAGGSTILAPDDGRVIMTVTSTAYGNFTVIDHGIIDGKRVTTAYAHQAAFLVREGQQVSKGDQIGVTGSTGYSTGVHLHFEVREDGTVVDPLTWLSR